LSGGHIVDISADTNLSTSAPLVLVGDEVGLAYNETNLQVDGGALDTIQDIDAGATPTFVGIQNTASALQLNAGADQDVTLFANAGSGQNPGFLLYGYITAASGARYYRVGVDDTNDEVLWTAQDSYIGGFAFQLPDNAGATALRVRDSDGAEVFSVDSTGALNVAGSAMNLPSTFTFDLATGAHRTVNFGNSSIDDDKSTYYYFYGCRRTVYGGGNRYFAIVFDSLGVALKANTSEMRIGQGVSSAIILGYGGTDGAPHIGIATKATSGQNPHIAHYGWISAASDRRYYRVKVDNINDEVLWTAQDSYITGFAIQLPDNAGGTEWRVRDSDGVIVASIDSDGVLTLGGDANLYRVSANRLATDDDLQLIGTGRIRGKSGYEYILLNYSVSIYSDTGTNSDVNLGTGSGGLGINIHGDTAYVSLGVNPDSPPSRLTLKGGTTAAEGIAFGDGTGTYDTNLYRAAADILQTDDKFVASSAQFGSDTDYLAIAEDGELTLVGDSRVRGFMRLDPKRFKIPAANYPGETFEGIFYTLDFDDSTEESAYAEVEIPCDWDNTTDISVSVYWFHDNADNGAVKWGLEYRAIKCGEVVSDATTTITEVSDGNHSAGELVCTTFTTGIAAADLERGDELAIRLYRDADDDADTLGEDARVIAVQFCYTKNRLGEPV